MIENENDFKSLRRLVALKRHEVPPPGYFNHFSDQVIQRIRAGERAEPESVGFLVRLRQLFDIKPAFATGFAGALCLLLLVGIVYANRPELAPAPMAHADSTAPLATLTPAALPQTDGSIGIVSSTNPVLNLQALTASAPSFTPQNPFAQSVSLTIPGN